MLTGCRFSTISGACFDIVPSYLKILEESVIPDLQLLLQ